MEVSEIKRLKIDHSLLPFMRERWTKNHDLREEKWHFLKIVNRYCVLS